MAIAAMTKVMVVSHRTEAAELLEAIQHAGVLQVLDAERAMVSKEWPELVTAAKRPKDIEEQVSRLDKSIEFLRRYAKKKTGLEAALAPKAIVGQKQFAEVVSEQESLDLLWHTERVEKELLSLGTEYENDSGILQTLLPWKGLAGPVEDIGSLEKTTCLTGLLPDNYFDEAKDKLGQLGAAAQQVGAAGNQRACLIVCLNETASEAQKILRSMDFSAVSFEGMSGTVSELIDHLRGKLGEIANRQNEERQKAGELAGDILKLEILYDHYQNLLSREQARISSPATKHAILFEGWVRSVDHPQLEKIVAKFPASSMDKIEFAEGEEIPVEIENKKLFRPFEVITRLYGMPLHFEVDPTLFLAPFFALFFGLCLTDAGYGLIMIAGAIYFIKKTQGDKKFGFLLLICSILTVICGAVTGGWFGNAIQLINIGWLTSLREYFLKFGFDPTENPMTFFKLSLIIGYFQLMVGISVAFFAKLFRKDYIGAVCDHLVWLVMLNCLAVYGLSRSGILMSAEQGAIFLKVAAVPGGMILLFSHREGGIVAKLGMGFYNLASTMFYIGDILSYVRLMALGMVTAGFAMAINQMAMLASEIKFIGPIVAIAVLIGGHLFNLAISALGSFVHSLRLQYVEFFPKFFEGGGKLFSPLQRENKYVYISNKPEFK